MMCGTSSPDPELSKNLSKCWLWMRKTHASQKLWWFTVSCTIMYNTMVCFDWYVCGCTTS